MAIIIRIVTHLVICYITMEIAISFVDLPSYKMVILHIYVGLPEGNS